MKDLRGRVALITGAASGIGRATAIAFAHAGADLILCDLDDEALAATAREARRGDGRPAQALCHRVDVASRDAMAAFAEEVHREHAAIDVLVNNAGVGLSAPFMDTTLDDWSWILGVNLLGVVHGCHYFLPPMIRRGTGGHVVNVSSAAGYVPVGPMAAYAATKHAVLGLSEALRVELLPHGIGVSAICPGMIRTRIIDTMRIRGAADAEARRRRVAGLYRRRDYGPERVARAILDAVTRNRAVVPVSPEAHLLYHLKRAFPILTPVLAARLSEGLLERLP